MKYRKGYKYQLAEDYVIKAEIRPLHSFANDYLSITINGLLSIFKGYAWDGPSGPTWDTKTFIRGSLVHDAIYQLIRHNHVAKEYKDYSDRLLQQICIEDGMNKIRAWYVYQAVKYFAGYAISPKSIKPIIEV